MGRVFRRALLRRDMAREVSNPDNPQVTLHTNHGDVVVELFADRAPKTVENFLGLARHDPPPTRIPPVTRTRGRTPKAARSEATRCTRGTSSTASSRTS